MSSKCLILWLLFSIILTGYLFGALQDAVINSTTNPNWTSLTFIIPVDVQLKEWRNCRNFSDVYCLFAYEAAKSNLNKAYDFDLQIVSVEFMTQMNQWIQHFAYTEGQKHFQPIYRHINNFMGEDGCCSEQHRKYFEFGLRELLLQHKEYVKKITNFSEEGKDLNLIRAFYLVECDLNVIFKLGFGRGKLRRSYLPVNGLAAHQIGAPYVLKVGSRWTPAIPYENPGDFLTFRWFKDNVLCVEQPWICKTKFMNLK